VKTNDILNIIETTANRYEVEAIATKENQLENITSALALRKVHNKILKELLK